MQIGCRLAAGRSFCSLPVLVKPEGNGTPAGGRGKGERSPHRRGVPEGTGQDRCGVDVAHPQTITPTSNYDEPCVAVAFATSQPGETLTDFRQRLSVRDYYTRTHGVELVLDRDAATELGRLLVPVVGRAEVGRMVDSP